MPNPDPDKPARRHILDSVLGRRALEQSEPRRDSLTGLLGRGPFDEAVAQLIGAGDPFALVIGGIDDLAAIEREHGRPAADETLRRIARGLERSIRGADACYRLGSEEFAMLLPEAPVKALPAVAERASQRVADVTSDLPVAVTFGVAVFPTDAKDRAALLAAAKADQLRRTSSQSSR